VILLDTHIWVWWVHDDGRLSKRQREALVENESLGLGVSAISCWEVAKLVERGRLALPCEVEEWMAQALSYPGIQLLDLTPRIAVESTRLPDSFHRDPADQLLVATARTFGCSIVTADEKILRYPHVDSVG
jgi:PIN domain nuclease of toxin-antitoxin system